MGQNVPAIYPTLPDGRLPLATVRLSILMFLLFAPPGAMLPLFTLRLQQLGFTPSQTAWACATQAVGSLVAPLLAGQAADRWFPAERCLTVCALIAGVLLWILAGLTSPLAVVLTCLAFWLVEGPLLTLATAFCLTHLAAPERDYGRVRLWGTIGWIVPGWLLGYWFINPSWLCAVVAVLRPAHPQSDLSDSIRLASLLSFALAGYSWYLPHTPPQEQVVGKLAPLAAFQALRSRAFAVFAGCTLAVCMTIAFGSQVTPLLLRHLGVPQQWVPPTLTISQSTEVASLAILPMILLRLGIRGTMRLGLTAWIAALLVLTLGSPVVLVICSLTLNGLWVCCYLVAGQLFVNSRSRRDTRASTQALLSVTTGTGLLFGNLLVGQVRTWANEEFFFTFAVAAGIALVTFAVFLLGFPDLEQMDGRKANGVEEL